jgi:hypothetical protein
VEGPGPVATSAVDLAPSYRLDPPDISVAAGTPTEPMVMQPGRTATFTFPGPGTYHDRCQLHPQDTLGSVQVGS